MMLPDVLVAAVGTKARSTGAGEQSMLCPAACSSHKASSLRRPRFITAADACAQIFLLDTHEKGRWAATASLWKEDLQWAQRLSAGWDLGRVQQARGPAECSSGGSVLLTRLGHALAASDIKHPGGVHHCSWSLVFITTFVALRACGARCPWCALWPLSGVLRCAVRWRARCWTG